MKASKFIFFIVLICVLFVADIAVGSVDVSLSDIIAAIFGGDVAESTRVIVIDIRLIKANVAILVGASLSVSGLEMQTLFRNPLAGPYVLGLSSGASLGVALFILGAPLFSTSMPLMSLSVAGAAWMGSAIVFAVIAAVGHRIKDIMVILILGMMFSSGVGAIVQILQYISREEALKSFVIWTMGSLGDVTHTQLWVFIPAVLLGLLTAVLAVKPLNLLLFGEEYARTMGLNVKRSRTLLFISTILLAGTSTAFCGPIGFIGLAMPHVSRMIFRDSNHRVLLPATLLVGACVMLICDIASKMFVLPVNAVAALVGIPVVVLVVLRNSR